MKKTTIKKQRKSNGGSLQENDLDIPPQNISSVDSEEVLEETSKPLAFNLDEIIPVSKNGSSKAIREYFESEVSLHNRDTLYKYYELKNDDDCIKDCASCMGTDNTYLTCFSVLYEKLSDRDNLPLLQIRNKENILEQKDILECNKCYLVGRCPQYKLNNVCGFDFTADTDFSDTQTALKILINIQRNRVLRGSLFEQVDGGVPDKNLTSEIQVLQELIRQIDDTGNPKFEMHVSGSGGATPGFMAALMSNIFTPKEKQLPKKDTQVLSEHAEVISTETKQIEQVKIDVSNKQIDTK